MTDRIIILNENTRTPNLTGAGIMRNRAAFTSRDMAADWPEAFVYAIVFGWGHPSDQDGDAWPEVAERYEWDDEMVAFLQDAHERFEKLEDRK